MNINRVGYIYNGAEFVGTLTEYLVTGGYEYEFLYDPGYLSSGSAQIGVNLPLTSIPYRRNHLPSFFANLMSEGWVNRHQARMARLDQDDKFGLLLGHGAELVGPIRIFGHQVSTGTIAASQVIPSNNLKGYTIDFARDEFNEVASKSLGKVSISGVQPKMFLTHSAADKRVLTNSLGIGPYIVKPSPKDLPELAINEFIIMRLCRAVGFDVADHALVPFLCGELAYVTPRFDVDHLGRYIGFIEDMASVMDVSPGNKSSDRLSYEMAIKVAHACSGYHAKVLRDGFLHVLMSYIVGNNDLHLKNMSLVRPLHSAAASGFSRVYDMVSVAPYREYDLSGELSLWLLNTEADNGFSTSSKEHYGYYTGHDFIAFAEAIYLGQKAGQSMINTLVKKVLKHVEPVLNSSPGSEHLKASILKRVMGRISTLQRPWL